MVYNCKITTYDAGRAPGEAQKRPRSAAELRAWLRALARVVPFSCLTESINPIEALRQIQRLRQSSDAHLLRILQVTRDLKRPPVNVVVKRADQLNINEQQQVNNQPRETTPK